ncbi:MAG: PhzF family phenazine biosynthesis protein [Bdellovibrionota bacterium]
MKKSKVYQVNAFTPKPGAQGGNAAGVVLNADSLTEHEMQAIAKEAGFSETAFISRSKIADFKIDFFTPTRRIPDCGHATVAAFSVLHGQNPNLSQTSKEIWGGHRREIMIEDGKVFMELPIPTLEKLEASHDVFSELFHNPVALKGAWHSRHDVGFLLIELKSEKDLLEISPNANAITDYSNQHNLIGIYAFVRTRGNDTHHSTTRMFAPAYGIPEEPATGMAAGLLTALLHQETSSHEFVIEQGRLMPAPSPSLLNSKIDAAGQKILVGGYSTVVGQER